MTTYDIKRWIVLLLACALLLPSGSAAAESSPGRAFWASLLVPGWGQRMAGRPQAALGFLLVEAGLWGGYFGLRQLAEVRRQHYRTYAAEHAGARPAGKDGEYFDDLGFYGSSQQHDAFALQGDGPEARLYAETDGGFWEWDDDGSRRRYRRLRNASESSKRNALYTTGLVLANHLLSAVHAARVTRDLDPALQLELAPASGWVGLRWRRTF